MKVNWIDENSIQCSICQEIKPREMYPWSTSNSRTGYYFSYCKACRKIRNKQNRLNRSPWKERCSKIGVRARELGIEFDLTGEFLQSLWESQKGLCFYTDYEMVWQAGNGLTGNNLSVDKIVPEVGYIKSNVVLCTHRANTIKNNMSLEELRVWMPRWYSRLQDRLEVL